MDKMFIKIFKNLFKINKNKYFNKNKHLDKNINKNTNKNINEPLKNSENHDQHCFNSSEYFEQIRKNESLKNSLNSEQECDNYFDEPEYFYNGISNNDIVKYKTIRNELNKTKLSDMNSDDNYNDINDIDDTNNAKNKFTNNEQYTVYNTIYIVSMSNNNCDEI